MGTSPIRGAWSSHRRWGRFSKDLLVGNVDDGRINAYNPRNGHVEGAVRGEDNHALVNDGLWGLVFGNGVIGTPYELVFAASIDDYANGLAGMIAPVRDDDDDDD